jgi:hypothetical protein
MNIRIVRCADRLRRSATVARLADEQQPPSVDDADVVPAAATQPRLRREPYRWDRAAGAGYSHASPSRINANELWPYFLRINLVDMHSLPFQFRLWHLFAASAVCSVICWFLSAVVLPAAAVGSRRDLSRAAQLLVAALHINGLSVCDQLR